MFGYPAAFVRGNFFSGLFEESRRDAHAGAAEARSSPRSRRPTDSVPVMGGKPMTDWYVVPAKIAASQTALAKLLGEALALAKELPEKKKKPKKKK